MSQTFQFMSLGTCGKHKSAWKTCCGDVSVIANLFERYEICACVMFLFIGCRAHLMDHSSAVKTLIFHAKPNKFKKRHSEKKCKTVKNVCKTVKNVCKTVKNVYKTVKNVYKTVNLFIFKTLCINL